MRFVTLAILALAVSVPAAGASAQSVQPVAGGSLTCTQISRECRKECPKEAPEQFCLGYCLDKKEECKKTGKWDGIRRKFYGVNQR